MAKIKPFKSVRYNQKINFKNVVAPPYDVISPSEQSLLYKKSKFNIVRLILGKTLPNDNKNNNKYTRAKKYFESWLKDNVLIQNNKDSVYGYKQDFLIKGTRYSRFGFFCLLKIEPLFKGSVYPHERTLSKPKADRLNLMKQCKANFSPIFALYDDKTKSIDKILQKTIKTKPLINIKYKNNEINRLWVVSDKKIVDVIVKKMQNKKIFIADGHHRYETALNYSKLTKNPNAKYVLTFLCNMSNSGLVVLPTYRLVKISSFYKKNFLKILEKYFIIKSIKNKQDLVKTLKVQNKGNEVPFGLYFNKKLYLLILKSKSSIKNKNKHSACYNELDVYVLQNIVFEQILKFSQEDIDLQRYIKYVKNFDESFKLVDNKAFDAAFILNSTKLDQIRRVATGGEVMPQKSTYFYPKLLTGMVINRIQKPEEK